MSRHATLSDPLRSGLVAGAVLACALVLPACGEVPKEAAKEAEEEAGPLPDVVIDGVPEEHFTDAVAVVNGVEIYRAAYDEILELLRDQIPEGAPGSVERYLRARDDALERAIDMELLFQEAARRGYEPEREELRKEYARRVAKAGSEEKYLAGARGHRLTKSEVVEGLRRQLAVERYLAEGIGKRLSVTDGEVREYYESHRESFTAERGVDLGSIFVDAPMGISEGERAKALTEISRALDRIRRGEPFEKVAREVSEDGAEHLGGRLGVVKRDSLPAPLDEVAFSLGEGEVSGILESEEGFHLLMVYGKVGGEVEPFEKVADKARERLLERKRNEQMYEVVKEARRTASIERRLS